MVVRPNMVCYSAVVLATVLLMLSCASSTPAERLTVHMPEPHDTLVAHVNLCISGASGKDIYVDEHGVGKSSLCPVANRPLRSRSSKVRASTPSRPRKSRSAAPAMASPPASKPASTTDLAIPATHAGKLVWPASCRHSSPRGHFRCLAGNNRFRQIATLCSLHLRAVLRQLHTGLRSGTDCGARPDSWAENHGLAQDYRKVQPKKDEPKSDDRPEPRIL